MFTPLNNEEIHQIVRMQLENVKRMLADNGVKLEISEKAIDWISLAGFDPQFGARPIKRAIQRHLLNELSKQIIAQNIDQSKTLLVDSNENGLIFSN